MILQNWLNNAHLCLMEKKPGSIDIDFFNELKSEVSLQQDDIYTYIFFYVILLSCFLFLMIQGAFFFV